jgi:hypothetical protein
MNDNEHIAASTAEALYVTMECRDLLSKGLSQNLDVDIEQNRTSLTLSQLTALAENRAADQTKKWWQIVNSNPKLQNDFRTILLHSGGLRQPQLAAAASDNITERTGEAFDLRLHMSSKNDGSAYLMISFHQPESGPFSYLFAKDDKGYHMMELSQPINGTVQLLLGPDHPVKDAFSDVAAEFFIK